MKKLSQKEEKILEQMDSKGGEFVKALAKTYRAGTATDRQKIKACWIEYWWAYEEMLNTKKTTQ